MGRHWACLLFPCRVLNTVTSQVIGRTLCQFLSAGPATKSATLPAVVLDGLPVECLRRLMLFDQVLVRAAQRFTNCFAAIRAETFTNTEGRCVVFQLSRIPAPAASSYSGLSQVAAAAPSSFPCEDHRSSPTAGRFGFWASSRLIRQCDHSLTLVGN